jgi:hypothetical protein
VLTALPSYWFHRIPGADEPVGAELTALLIEIEFGSSRGDDHGFRCHRYSI